MVSTMLWTKEMHSKYKTDEDKITRLLKKIVDQPSDISFESLVEKLCEQNVSIPSSTITILKRVIQNREYVEKAYKKWGLADQGHRHWIELLQRLQARLELHYEKVKASKEKSILREYDLENGRIAQESANESDSLLAEGILSTYETSGGRITSSAPTIDEINKYQTTVEQIAMARTVQSLAEIRDWIMEEWILAARGERDFVTAAYSTKAAERVAVSILYGMNETTDRGWDNTLFQRYARKAGILRNENEYISKISNGRFAVLIRHELRVRVHIFSVVDEFTTLLNVQQLSGSDVLSQMKRSFFCAILKGWDIDTPRLSEIAASPYDVALQDKCLLTAIIVQQWAVESYKARKDLTMSKRDKAFLESVENLRSRHLKIGLDPWTQALVVGDLTAIARFKKQALSFHCLCVSVYVDRYRMFRESSKTESELQKAFGPLIFGKEPNTISELERSWKLYMQNPNKKMKKTDIILASWSLEEHIPKMLQSFEGSSTDYISMLNNIGDHISGIYNRTISLSKFPSWFRNGQCPKDIMNPLSELSSKKLSDLAGTQLESPTNFSGLAPGIRIMRKHNRNINARCFRVQSSDKKIMFLYLPNEAFYGTNLIIEFQERLKETTFYHGTVEYMSEEASADYERQKKTELESMDGYINYDLPSGLTDLVERDTDSAFISELSTMAAEFLSCF